MKKSDIEALLSTIAVCVLFLVSPRRISGGRDYKQENRCRTVLKIKYSLLSLNEFIFLWVFLCVACIIKFNIGLSINKKRGQSNIILFCYYLKKRRDIDVPFIMKHGYIVCVLKTHNVKIGCFYCK